MKINSIRFDWSTKRLENKTQQEGFKTSNPIAPSTSMPISHAYSHSVLFGNGNCLIAKRPFLNALSSFYGIPSPYDGVPMFPSAVFKNLQEQLDKRNPLEYTKLVINTLSKPNNKACLRPHTAEVFDKIVECSNKNPEFNLHEIMKELKKVYVGKLFEKQMNILNVIDLASKSLSHNLQQDIHTLTSITRDEIALDQEDVFRNKIFRERLNEIFKQYPNEDSKTVMNIRKAAKKLPESKTSADAFITKYARQIEYTKDKAQCELSKQIKEIDEAIKTLAGRKKYNEISPYIMDLKVAVLNNKNYTSARKNLINNIRLIDNNQSFEQCESINQKVRSLPESFTCPETDLKQRIFAIVNRMVGDATMSADHIKPQSHYEQLIKAIKARHKLAVDNNDEIGIRETTFAQKRLEEERDSVENIIIADKHKNTQRLDTDFANFIQTNPKIASTYVPAYFSSIFKLFENGKISKEFLPDLDRQIDSVESYSRGIIEIDRPETLFPDRITGIKEESDFQVII